MTEARKKAVEVLKSFNTAKNQGNMILTHLFAIGPLDPIEALERYRCLRLGARIYDLKKLGVPIETVMIYRDGKKWASYRLEGDE